MLEAYGRGDRAGVDEHANSVQIHSVNDATRQRTESNSVIPSTRQATALDGSSRVSYAC